MKSLFDKASFECSKVITGKYSTSFSLGIKFLDKELRKAIYAIYGFVRLADEIVDSFHEYDKRTLLNDFIDDTYKALHEKISLNPVLNSFQETIYRYEIDIELINSFLESMRMDLDNKLYTEASYYKYIYGSAESVGLMCLHIFTGKDKILFNDLKPFAMKLGAAFQKVNFLRDANNDNELLGRTYFPGVNMKNFSYEDKIKIENEIESDFNEALKGIRLLPASSRNGVYLAYYYYNSLFKKIRQLPPNKILKERIRVPNYEKIYLLFKSNIRYQLDII